MGLELISFNVQNFIDYNKVIENLGIDNIVTIQKNAEIAKANSEKEIVQAKSKADKEANYARVTAEQDIAIKNNELALKQSELKIKEDEKKAEADKYKRMQEADVEQYKAKKEYEILKDKAEAELVAEQKKAEAMNKMQQAAVIEMVVEKLPDIVKNAASPLANVDSITMYDEGNGAKMVDDIMTTTDNVIKGLEGAVGLDIKSLISGALGSTLIENKNNCTTVDDESLEFMKE